MHRSAAPYDARTSELTWVGRSAACFSAPPKGLSSTSTFVLSRSCNQSAYMRAVARTEEDRTAVHATTPTNSSKKTVPAAAPCPPPGWRPPPAAPPAPPGLPALRPPPPPPPSPPPPPPPPRG
eukprot:8562126-Pyramimonas_sp.AAC.2